MSGLKNSKCKFLTRCLHSFNVVAHILVSGNNPHGTQPRTLQRKDMFSTSRSFLIIWLRDICTFIHSAMTNAHNSIICIFVASFTAVVHIVAAKLLIFYVQKVPRALGINIDVLEFLIDTKTWGPLTWVQSMEDKRIGFNMRQKLPRRKAWRTFVRSMYVDFCFTAVDSSNTALCLIFAVWMAALWYLWGCHHLRKCVRLSQCSFSRSRLTRRDRVA